MLNLDDYKTEHLFLLIGENPLPNYVAAKLLTKTPTTRTDYNQGKPVLHLVCSADTEKYATHLQIVLDKDEYSYGDGFIQVNPSDYDDIQDKLADRIRKIGDNASIGLHYTGGTKAMSVHTYRAIEILTDKWTLKPKFSYLDARNLEMRFDEKIGNDQVTFKIAHFNDERDSSVKTAIKERFDKSSISLESLLILHGIKFFPRLNNPRTIVRFESLVNFLLENYHKNSWESFRKKWQYNADDSRKLGEKCLLAVIEKAKEVTGYKPPKAENKAAFEAKLREQKIQLPNIVGIEDAFNSVFANVSLADNSELILGNLPLNESAEDFCNFLNGTWLEDYVLKQVLECAAKCNLGDYGSSLEIALLDNSGNARSDLPFFEIDVVVMRGYQLFAISCTLSGDHQKQKLFEIKTRAEQLGGAETRVGLVTITNANGKEVLEQQINDKKIKVFGKCELKDSTDFIEQLEDWFNGKA
jgi:Domain of unknown function (DUF1887)